MTKTQVYTNSHKVYGPVMSDECGACSKDSVWMLTKNSEDFSLFGTPLFNLKTEYALICGNCGYGVGIYKDLFHRLQTIAETNRAKQAI